MKKNQNFNENEDDEEENDNDDDESVILNIKKGINIAPQIQQTRIPELATFSHFQKTQKMTYNPKYKDINLPSFGPSSSSTTTNNNSKGYDKKPKVADYFIDDFAFNRSYYKKERKKKKKLKKQLKDEYLQIEISNDNDIDINEEFNKKYQGFDPSVFITEDDNNDQEMKDGDGQGMGEKRKRDDDTDEVEVVKKTKLISSSYDLKGKKPKNLLSVSGKDNFFDGTKKLCFLPKKSVTVLSYTSGKTGGHNSGVNCIRWFPKYGHFLLSASIDSTVKLWDVFKKKRVVQTYYGYGLSVIDIDFKNDGREFLASSEDGTVKVWDTEMGKVTQTFTLKNDANAFNVVANCVKWHQVSGNQILGGYKNNRVVQWDVRLPSGSKYVNIYDKHQGAINSIVFLQNDSKFVTASNDKSLRVWEYNNSTDSLKYLFDSFVRRVVKMNIHPIEDNFCVQSSSNHIFVYESNTESFKLVRNKRFKGHKITHYPVNFGFSNDGKWVYSGDCDGNVWFWRWNVEEEEDLDKLNRLRKAHTNVVLDCQWHPCRPSYFATCSWDSTIKIWK